MRTDASHFNVVDPSQDSRRQLDSLGDRCSGLTGRHFCEVRASPVRDNFGGTNCRWSNDLCDDLEIGRPLCL